MTEDSLEQVQREIDAYKAEALSGRVPVEDRAERKLVSEGKSPARPESVFACNPSEEIYTDLCVCDDPETPPWRRCPMHNAAID